jgi:hypothetical protein
MPPSLTPELSRQIAKIEPSLPWPGIVVYPCAVRTKGGVILPRVYFAEPSMYVNRSSISLDDISAVFESPDRLPARFANCLYQAGESGMGYMVFRVVFRFGLRFSYLTGNLVDFLQFPPLLGPAQVRDVLPYGARRKLHARGALPAAWCFFTR